MKMHFVLKVILAIAQPVFGGASTGILQKTGSRFTSVVCPVVRWSDFIAMAPGRQTSSLIQKCSKNMVRQWRIKRM